MMIEPQVFISVMLAAVAFVVIVAVLWRTQSRAWDEPIKDEKIDNPLGVTTADMVTSHTPAPLVLSYVDGETEEPNETQITAALTGLESNSDDTVMLDDADHTENYLQAYIAEDGSYCVEYHDGTNNRHYRAEPNPDFATTQTLFFMFNRRDWDGLKRTSGWRDTTNSY